MNSKMIGPVLIGAIGAAILLGLSVWQMQRLVWKQGILASIEARIQLEPVSLPEGPDELWNEYQAVFVDGRILPGEVHVLVSHRDFGPAYRVIAPLRTGERVILLDRGLIPITQKDVERPLSMARFNGNLLWPDESGSMFDPEPDLEKNIWFARDLHLLADTLNTEPILLVLRSSTEETPGAHALPVDIAGIPNNHLNYAITWFLFAVCWLGMTGFWLWRIRRKRD